MAPAQTDETKTGEATAGADPERKPKAPTLLDKLRSGQEFWALRFKGVRGVQDVLILAADAVRAEAVGRAWVNAQPGRLYLEVKPALVADESILATVSSELVGAGAERKR